MTHTHRRVLLAKRPVGLVQPTDFEFVDGPLPEPSAGEFRVRIVAISLDPAMRGWMRDAPSYVPPVQIGAVMRANAAGIVEASNHPDYQVGDAVTGMFGVQTHALSDGRGVVKVDQDQAPLERWIGGLGMPGTTAWLGLHEIGKPQPGETVLVSGAAGAVGSIVGQIAKIEGCRVVGIAGGPDKCAHLTEVLGLDAAVDYKAGNLRADLAAACPDGVDVYWENVGGEIFDAVLPHMNPFGRIPVCGWISAYNDTRPAPGPKNLPLVVSRRLRIQGFIVFDFAQRYAEAARDLGRWHSEGKLVMQEDVRTGPVDAFPEVLNRLFSGEKLGKLVLKLD